MMIELHEHFQFGESKGLLGSLVEGTAGILSCNKEDVYRHTVKRHGEDALCFQIRYLEKEEKYHCETSYFVGVDWVVEDRLPVYVQPKQNNAEQEIDYLSMLFEALEEPQNLDHLEGLCEIYFDKPDIQIEQKQDLLSPFLVVQFLQVLRRIAQKGLKKSYYPVTCNLEARVKGKILIHRSVKENIVKSRTTKTVCRYDEFGYDDEENKILKKAFLFAQRVIQQYNIKDSQISVQQIVNYITPVFESVSDDIRVDGIKVFKPNPLYREYDQALKLALLILKRFSYNITRTEDEKRTTPPFWIDMSKLFELFVFKRLTKIFPGHDEVRHHLKANYQELDFLIKGDDGKFMLVVDAKYKPRYHDGKVLTADIRQLCGYARLKKVYEELGLEDYNRNLDCLIIYSHQKCDSQFTRESLISKKAEDGYVNFNKVGIRLPVIQ